MSVPRTWANLPVAEIAAEFGTPVFIYDGDLIRTQFQRLTRHVTHRPLEIYYSVKANSALGILRLLRSLGARADVCSAGDLAFAEAAGFTPNEISFTGCGLADSEYALITARPGMDFVADSVHQLARMVELTPGRPVGLRLNPAIEAGFHPHVRAGSINSRFGIRPPEVEVALELAAEARSPIVGLHGHLGSDVFDVDPFLRLAEQLCSLAATIPTVQWLNLGGGLGNPADSAADPPQLDALNSGLAGVLRQLDPARGTRLRVEPGSFLTMSSGLLVARVTDMKPGNGSDGTVCVDASSNHLVSAVIYDAHHPVSAVRTSSADVTATYDVAGNLMQAGDILAKGRQLPEVRIGDLLVFGRCGAYSSSRSTTFNNQGRPAEVLVLEGEARLLRRREEPADLLRFDV